MGMRKIYRQIAKKNGVTLAEVKRDMQEAIAYAYKNTPDDGITAAYQKHVPHKGETPTVDEVIRYAAQKVREEKE